MKLINSLAGFATVVILIGFAADAQAQQPSRLSEREMKSLLERIDKGASSFRDSLNNALGESRFDDTNAEDRISDFVKEFEQATDRLKGRFDDDRSAASVVQEVLMRASRIDGFMARNPLTTRAQGDWAYLRRNLDELAAAYNVSWNWTGISNQPERITDERLRSLLHRMEKDAERFRSSLKDALGDSRFDDTRAEDDINRFVRDFAAATERLKDRFSKNQTAPSDAEEVLRRAASINNFMQRHALSQRSQRDWSSLRSSLDEVGTAYGVTWRW